MRSYSSVDKYSSFKYRPKIFATHQSTSKFIKKEASKTPKKKTNKNINKNISTDTCQLINKVKH